ncbi:mechanosensitive ion channel family protein [Paenibacillus sp. IB182496]|uniref:Mechanosensitive ion channel family protein n=1 Tax=Paenibacillus sabuli TaxID=2772509 RepID=A0A927BU57_9BACL|nr:mechanosensitive ion channel family protein [Paenibacillus sabuli]MBD2845574.1 mechanosensitive ion channel family protein [Paenibacillus sabuli]
MDSWLEEQSSGFGQYFTWAYWSDNLQLVLSKAIILIVILALTWVLLRVRQMIIQRAFAISRLDQKQRDTLESLLMSFTRYVIFIIAALLCLSNIGMDIGPVIASAGVIGLAVGFGAQTLVKDLITGFFIIFEDQFSVGDYVTINNGEINGTVVSVGLRATKIRTWAQHVVVIQNSEIKVSQNYNRDRMRAIVNITVPYETDPSAVENAVNAISEKMVGEMPHLFLLDDKGQVIEPPQLYGITDVENAALGAKYTATCLVTDTHYWTACNVMRKLLIEELRTYGVQISYPRRVELMDVEQAR